MRVTLGVVLKRLRLRLRLGASKRLVQRALWARSPLLTSYYAE